MIKKAKKKTFNIFLTLRRICNNDKELNIKCLRNVFKLIMTKDRDPLGLEGVPVVS